MKEETKCYCGHTTYCDCGPEQERSYSEEDLRIAFTEGHDSARMKGSYKSNGTFEEDWNQWFEQFKKK
jgi:hypothetical protein